MVQFPSLRPVVNLRGAQPAFHRIVHCSRPTRNAAHVILRSSLVAYNGAAVNSIR